MSLMENVVDGPTEQSKVEPHGDLGVLFVHGIGQQKQGQTLVEAGDALVSWLRRWIVGGYNVVQVRETILKTSGEAPAHSTLSLNIPGQKERTWLLAESWWAENFFEPGFNSLATWAFKVLPWAIYSHFGVQARQNYDSIVNTLAQFAEYLSNLKKTQQYGWLRKLLSLLSYDWVWLGLFFPLYLFMLVFYSLIAHLLIGIFLPVIILLLVLALIPLSFTQSLAGQLQQVLSAFIGDSYIFLTSPLQAASITNQVQHDLCWLVQRCCRVVVVAHSQGAAVVVNMLRQDLMADLTSDSFQLITYGSGLKKLDGLHEAQQNKEFWGAYGSLGSFLVLCGLILLLWSEPPTDFRNTIILIFISIPAFLYMLIVPEKALKKTFDINYFDPKVLFGAQITWHDYFASQDPVTNGPLYNTSEKKQHDENIPVYTKGVHNRGSLLFDHTTYWENLDGFVGLVARNLAHFDNVQIDKVSSDDCQLTELALYRRRWRTNALIIARYAAALVLALLLFSHWHNLGTIGLETKELLQGAKSYSLDALIDPTLQSIDLAGLRSAGGIMLALAVFLGYQLLYQIWRWWENRDIQAFFQRSDYDQLGLELFLWVGVVIAIAVWIVCIDWSQGNEIFTKVIIVFVFLFLSPNLFFWGVYIFFKTRTSQSKKDLNYLLKRVLRVVIVIWLLLLPYFIWLLALNKAAPLSDINLYRGLIVPFHIEIRVVMVMVSLVVGFFLEPFRNWLKRHSGADRSPEALKS